MEDDAEGLGVKNFDREKKGDRSDELLNSEGRDSLETRRASDLDTRDQHKNLPVKIWRKIVRSGLTLRIRTTRGERKVWRKERYVLFLSLSERLEVESTRG